MGPCTSKKGARALLPSTDNEGQLLFFFLPSTKCGVEFLLSFNSAAPQAGKIEETSSSSLFQYAKIDYNAHSFPSGSKSKLPPSSSSSPSRRRSRPRVLPRCTGLGCRGRGSPSRTCRTRSAWCGGPRAFSSPRSRSLKWQSRLR